MREDKGTRLAEIAEELRAIAVNGLHWAANDYDRARYDKSLHLAAELLSMSDSRQVSEIEEQFRGDLSIRTPFVGVDAAIFDNEGRLLLIQRKDNGTWAMPGGAADVGEPPSAVAVRETWEETGLRIQPRSLVGVYDSRLVGSPDAVHLYHLVFLCDVIDGALKLTNETIGYGYFAPEEIRSLPLHRGHGVRIADTFSFHSGETTQTRFQ
jgi:8-oxo-dGTP pyrophosphatase MutT (NUDIX family)